MKFKKGHTVNNGRIPWNKGKILPKISKEDKRYKRACELCDVVFFLDPRRGIGYSDKTGRGRFCSDKCNRIYSRGQHRSKNTEFKIGNKRNYNEVTLETRKKISASLMGISLDEWTGFSTKERLRKMNSKEYKKWRKDIFERDNYTCQWCFRRSGEGLKLFLEAHHILRIKDKPELIYDIENGITLCSNCHKKTLKNKNKIGIIGSEGWVGSAMVNLFKDVLQVIPYDEIGIGTQQQINTCPISIIAVPTPLKENGKLDTSIVEKCVSWCKSPLILIRSTVMPGTCDYLSKKYKKNIVFSPEYLGETVAHPLFEEDKRQFLILGGSPENRRKIIELYQQVYNANITIRQVTNYEAEVIKLSENRAIAFKVAQCQELYDVCEKARIDYYTIRDAVYGDDPRFNMWWTFIYPEKRGFCSKCIPKDVYGWAAWAESVGYKPELTKKLLEVNDRYINGRKTN